MLASIRMESSSYGKLRGCWKTGDGAPSLAWLCLNMCILRAIGQRISGADAWFLFSSSCTSLEAQSDHHPHGDSSHELILSGGGGKLAAAPAISALYMIKSGDLASFLWGFIPDLCSCKPRSIWRRAAGYLSIAVKRDGRKRECWLLTNPVTSFGTPAACWLKLNWVTICTDI